MMGLLFIKSLAIIDYLEAKYPQNSVYPSNVKDAAMVKAMAMDIACEVHPLNNLRVQQFLSGEMGVSDQKKLEWLHHWMHQGFTSIEQQLAQTSGKFCFADKVTLADMCLIPQIYNANRFNVDLSNYSQINKVVENCAKLEAFVAAQPENQLDALQ